MATPKHSPWKMWPLTIKIPDTSGFIASPPALERADEGPIVLLGLGAPRPHACGLVVHRSACSSHAPPFTPPSCNPTAPQRSPLTHGRHLLFFFFFPSLSLFPCIVCLLTSRKGVLPPGKQTRQLPRAAGCKHRMICHPHLVNH